MLIDYRRSALALLACLALFAAGCGVARSGRVGDDSGVDPGTDAFVDPGTDASTGEDPLNAAPTCTSGRMWGLGDFGSQVMNPGLACIACHSISRGAPTFTAAGTVYPSGHEPDRCNGASGAITVELRDATGRTAMVTPNSVGNFFYQGALTLPITAAVHYQGRTREMITPAASGDCNSCHTQNGDMSAPGRITLP
jgi:hypothetical protein